MSELSEKMQKVLDYKTNIALPVKLDYQKSDRENYIFLELF